MCRPRGTIAIPTFNRATWVRGAARAALAQTYHDYEVLVSDNASTDETQPVLAELRDVRLRIIRQKHNLGLAGNWNACLAESRGEYMALVPDDDRVAPWFLQRCFELVDLDPTLPIVITLSDFSLATEGGRTSRAPSNPRLGTGIWDGTEILGEFLEDRLSAQMCSILFRVEALRAQGGFPDELPFSLDKGGWAPLLLNGRAGFVNESCGTFSQHATNHTNNLDVSLCIADEWKFTHRIMTLAMGQVDDPNTRHDLSLKANHYFGRRVLEILASHRKEGASLLETVPLIWQWGRSLVQLRVATASKLARLLSILLLPRPATEWIRRLKRHYGQAAGARDCKSIDRE